MRTLPTVVLVIVAILGVACTNSDSRTVQVQPIEEILASGIDVEADPSGTVATLRVRTRIPVVCAVAYGQGDDFGSIATDDDMAGGAHSDHAPRLSGLEPDNEYRYVLQGSDAAGNLYSSEVMTFRTPVAEASSGRNVATRSTVVDVSSQFSDAFAADHAVDGDLGTEWSTAGDGDDASITIDLGRPTDIVGARLRTRQMSDGSAVVRSFSVTVDDTETFGPFSTDDQAIAEFTTRGRALRFDAVDTTGGNTGAVEIEVYAPGADDSGAPASTPPSRQAR